MGTAEMAAIIAALALSVNVLRDLFNGGWSISTRLSIMENQIKAINESLSNISKTLEVISDMKQEHALLDQRVIHLAEDMRMLRQGRGFIHNTLDTMIRKEEG